MTSRRAVLGSVGLLGVASVAGCSALPFGNDDGTASPDVSLPPDVVEPISWPESPFPTPIPSSLARRHRERATELLGTVPRDPSVPNGAIAEELRSERDRAADRLEEPTDESWATEQLSEWRHRLNAAATVRGAYRAATGEDDAPTVAKRRQAIRDDLHAFVSDHEYRASSPLEAVLAHAPIEALVADGRGRVRPSPAYPADPVADPFQAGDAVGRVELARATVDDARRLSELYRTERSDARSQWGSLIGAADRLRFTVDRTRASVDSVLDADERPFDTDLEGTAGRWLFDSTSRRVVARADAFAASRDDGDYATAVVEAGRTLATIEALRTTTDGIRDGAYQETVTVESVSRAAERARDAIAAIEESETPKLATLIARPAIEFFHAVPESIEEGYADAPRVQGGLARTELYARAVPSATASVIDRFS